jgi:hypothetical protein
LDYCKGRLSRLRLNGDINDNIYDLGEKEMKLQNKKTREIGYLYANKNENYNVLDADDKVLAVYPSLAELNEEWEDYKEPKTFWHILSNGGIMEKEISSDELRQEFITDAKQVGNYFETEQEAEKAVEKLKAWKRLKDKGLKFEGWGIGGEYGSTITFSDDIEYNDETRADLDLLFGGKE